MPTVINNPVPTNERENGLGFFLGIILIIVFGIVFFIYGIPFIRSFQGTQTPQINIPNQIDVNVKQDK